MSEDKELCWDYHIEHVTGRTSTGLGTTELNALGEKGWELIAYREYKRNSDDSIVEQFAGKLICEYTFKRRRYRGK